MKRTVLGEMLSISRRQSSRDRSGREPRTVNIMSHRDSNIIYRVTNHEKKIVQKQKINVYCVQF